MRSRYLSDCLSMKWPHVPSPAAGHAHSRIAVSPPPRIEPSLAKPHRVIQESNLKNDRLQHQLPIAAVAESDGRKLAVCVGRRCGRRESIVGGRK